MLASDYFKEAGLDKTTLGLFEEMCRWVGTTLDDPRLDVGEEKPFIWNFDAYEWTEKEENDFRVWAIDYLSCVKAGSKRVIKSFLSMWLLNYSWRYKK
jgi:hypothetical protein